MNLTPKTAEDMVEYFKSVSQGKQLEFLAKTIEDINRRLDYLEEKATEPTKKLFDFGKKEQPSQSSNSGDNRATSEKTTRGLK